MIKIGCLFLVFPMACFSQNGGQSTIKGVVTYFFNQYQGDKPDIGAKVWIIDSANAPEFDITRSDTFHFANFYREIAAGYRALKEKEPAMVTDNLAKWGGNDDNKFKLIDKQNALQLYKYIVQNTKAIPSTIDASGSFSTAVPPGTYYVYMRSNNRTSLTLSESGGKIDVQKIHAEPGGVTDVSHKFDIR